MELTISDIEEDAYQNFLDYIPNKETLRKYRSYLKMFLDLIPDPMFARYLERKPQSRSVEHLASAFTEISTKNIRLGKSIIKAYIRNLKEEIENKTLSAGTVHNRIKPIKALLAANEVDVSWRMVDRSIPKPGKSEDRAYTRKEIQMMMEKVVDITDKIIIVMFSSAGFRLEAWDYFCWKDVVFFKNDDGTFKGAALQVYRGDIEEYWTFITPEACELLMLYRENWKARFLRYPEDDDPLLVSVRYDKPRRLRYNGIKGRVENFVSSIGIRGPLQEGAKRHEVMLDHGFRKYFNTMLRRAKVYMPDKEDMMGHSIGLEDHYERYEEKDFERFPEYQKAIPFLTISDVQRTKYENEKLKQEKSELIKKNQKIDSLEVELNKLKKQFTKKRNTSLKLYCKNRE